MRIVYTNVPSGTSLLRSPPQQGQNTLNNTVTVFERMVNSFIVSESSGVCEAAVKNMVSRV